MKNYTEPAKVASTQQERIDALNEAKTLLAGTSGGFAQVFSGTTVTKGGSQYPDPLPLFRVAEYITTGHDYFDTHPVDGDEAEDEETGDE